MKLHAITGVRYDRRLADERQLFRLHKPGQQVRLEGLSFPVTIAWFYLKRDGETRRSKRYVLCTRPLKACTIVWWGQHRWQIEGFFKTAKHRFDLHRLVSKRCWECTAGWSYLSLHSSWPIGAISH